MPSGVTGYAFRPLATDRISSSSSSSGAGRVTRRLKEISIGREDVACPARYAIWAQGLGGEYKPLREYAIEGTEPQIEW
jgi:hypothetical protein